MSVNKLLTFINHNHDRRRQKTTHHWTNQISEYDFVNLQKPKFSLVVL